jgi:hypothetical protein
VKLEPKQKAAMKMKIMITPKAEAELNRIKTAAKSRHERARKAAKQRGRFDFPDLPFECSWAYEEEFFKARPGSRVFTPAD